MTPVEVYGLMREIASNPDDDSLYQMYADHLEESGNIAKANLVRESKDEPRYGRKRFIYNQGHCNYYSRPEILAAYPELCLHRNVPDKRTSTRHAKMNFSLRGSRMVLHWKQSRRGRFQDKCHILIERGLVRELLFDWPTFFRHSSQIIAKHPVRLVQIIDVPGSRHSIDTYYDFYLYKAEDNHERGHHLPQAVFKKLKHRSFDLSDMLQWNYIHYQGSGRTTAVHFARKDIQQACLAYGIEQAEIDLGLRQE